jgi:hypothetical membrane protein
MNRQREERQGPGGPPVEEATQVAERRTVLAALAVAGIAGPILFTVAFVVQGLLRPDYSPVAEPVSALAVGPNGWVQDVNFFVLGPLMLAYAVGLHLGVRPARAGMVGPALLAVSAAGIVLAGAVPMRQGAGGVTDEPAGHEVAAFMIFLGAGAGLMAISRRLAADPRWRSLAAFTLAGGATIVVLFLAIGVLASTPDAPFYRWFGLAQRVLIAVYVPCTVVLALRLLRVASTADVMRRSTPTSDQAQR